MSLFLSAQVLLNFLFRHREVDDYSLEGGTVVSLCGTLHRSDYEALILGAMGQSFQSIFFYASV